MNHRFVKARLVALLLAAASWLTLTVLSPAMAAEPAADKPEAAKAEAGKSTANKPAAKPAAKKPVAKTSAAKATKPVPQACGAMIGVERAICVECDGVAFFKRIGCQQRVFWTQCKGKRLFEDSYCQMHENRGPPGE